MSTDLESQEHSPMPPPPDAIPAAERYRAALRRLPPSSLSAILQGLGSFDRAARPNELAAAVYERLEESRFVEGLIARLGPVARIAVGLFAVTENPVWPFVGLEHTLSALGSDGNAAIAELISYGMLVPTRDGDAGAEILVAHPTVLSVARTVLPEGPRPPDTTSVRQIRQSDGLEPILRLAALWQRVEESALRRTQQGTLYKKDRERIEDDPVLAGPIADSLEPLPDPANLWLALARSVGMVVDETGSDRTVAAPAEFWADNAVHLPQMLASRWLGLRTWHEAGGFQSGDSPLTLAIPFLRVAVMLWLATIEPDRWVALDDLATHLDGVYPGWNVRLLDKAPVAEPVRGRIGAEARAKPGVRGKRADEPSEEAEGIDLLRAIVLGPAYQLGLVLAAEEEPTGRRVVRLTHLGRYALGLGRPPAPRETFEHFVFVQPNFEVIAYRQGLNPSLIGTLSRFMTWVQSGAALEMKLTPESVYRGLESGLTPDAMLDRLGRHSSRPLPAGVAEALRTWSSRRDRVTYYTAATLIEFASAEALEGALGLWADADRPAPRRVTDRLLLVEDESDIPFAGFRLAGSRDYTRPPETCVEVESDGVSLALDVSRSDLFVDAELAKFADLLPDDGRGGPARRRYRVSPESLRRAVEDGFTPAGLARWFAQRAGAEVPPALRLLLHAAGPAPEPFGVATRVVLTAPSGDLLDGLLQHPATRGLIGERLGPSTAAVPDANLASLRAALGKFGLGLAGEDDSRA